MYREWGERSFTIILVSLFSLLFAWSGFAAPPVRSDCTAADLKILRDPALRHQILKESRLLHEDCTVLQRGKPDPKLMVLFVLEGLSGGKESYLAVFHANGLSVKSRAIFKSESLGSDALPILANGGRRLIFALPQVDPKTVVFYTNILDTPHEARFQKWELKLSRRKLTPVENREWPVDKSKVPRIYSEKSKWKGIVNRKLVEL